MALFWSLGAPRAILDLIFSLFFRLLERFGRPGSAKRKPKERKGDQNGAQSGPEGCQKRPRKATFLKSVDPRSECLEPSNGGKGLPPPYHPPLDTFVIPRRKTSRGSSKTPKPKPLSSRAVQKPRTPRGGAPQRVTLGLIWEIGVWASRFWGVLGLGFEVLGLGFEVLGLGSAVLGLDFEVLAVTGSDVLQGGHLGGGSPNDPPPFNLLGRFTLGAARLSASDSSLNITSRKHVYTMGRRRRPMAARSAACRRRRHRGAKRRPIRLPARYPDQLGTIKH